MLPGHPKSALQIHLQPAAALGVQRQEQEEQHRPMEAWLPQGRQRGMGQERSRTRSCCWGNRDHLLPGVEKSLPACCPCLVEEQ